MFIKSNVMNGAYIFIKGKLSPVDTFMSGQSKTGT